MSFSQVTHLWPIAISSLSLRRNRCIREHCPTRKFGEGRPAMPFYIRRPTGRSVIYVPDNLQNPSSAIANGRKLHDLMWEARKRYLKATKVKRSKP